MRRLALAGLVALALAPAARGDDQSVAVRAAVTPRSHLFGDRIEAEVDVVVARDVADSVVVRADFQPYTPLGPPTVARLTGRASAELRYRYSLDCLDRACLPGDARRRIVFAPAHVRVRIGGRVHDAPATWPALIERSRLAPEDVSARRLRSSVYPLGSASYRVSPSTLFWGLVAAAGVLAAVGAALLGSLLLGIRIPWRRDRFARLGPLERALVLVRMSAEGVDVPRRRRALERLGHELEAGGRRELADEACRLAWAESAPDGAALVALAGRVEAEVSAR